MPSINRWIGVAAALGIISALVPVVQGANVAGIDLTDPLGKLEKRVRKSDQPDLKGLDLIRLKMRPQRVTTPLSGGRLAELTLDPELQRSAKAVMKRYRIPEAGAVLMDIKTGKLLVYASHVSGGEQIDVNVRAEAPAASVFKIITSSALVEIGGLSASTEQCYHGGRSRIGANELKDNPARDKWCASLAMALGSSINVGFARLAQKNLTPEDLSMMGGAFGMGAPIPFAVKTEASKIDIPEDPLEFARTAAGFWNTSLSPLQGALIAATVANQGVTLRPRIVEKIFKGREEIWTTPEEPQILRRAIKADTAREVTKMMIQTVASGSGFKTFHDRKRNAFLPGMQVAGKTGTLTRHKANRHYTWFVGFAPANKPEVAVAALVVNTPIWRIKGPTLAREVLRAYFAKQGRRGVSRP